MFIIIDILIHFIQENKIHFFVKTCKVQVYNMDNRFS